MHVCGMFTSHHVTNVAGGSADSALRANCEAMGAETEGDRSNMVCVLFVCMCLL